MAKASEVSCIEVNLMMGKRRIKRVFEWPPGKGPLKTDDSKGRWQLALRYEPLDRELLAAFGV